MLSNLDSLFARCLRTHYFPHGNFMIARDLNMFHVIL